MNNPGYLRLRLGDGMHTRKISVRGRDRLVIQERLWEARQIVACGKRIWLRQPIYVRYRHWARRGQNIHRPRGGGQLRAPTVCELLLLNLKLRAALKERNNTDDLSTHLMQRPLLAVPEESVLALWNVQPIRRFHTSGRGRWL